LVSGLSNIRSRRRHPILIKQATAVIHCSAKARH
jgi:hypothetical protein